MVLGPQEEAFTPESVDRFLKADWHVTQDADRMGLRLEGPKLDHVSGFNITSDGIASGSIQVPGTGKPIILLVDRHTSGGYPKIATVISTDMPALGQKKPGDIVRFDAVDVEQAVEIRREWNAFIVSLAKLIEPLKPAGGVDLDALYSHELITAFIQGAED